LADHDVAVAVAVQVAHRQRSRSGNGVGHGDADEGRADLVEVLDPPGAPRAGDDVEELVAVDLGDGEVARLVEVVLDQRRRGERHRGGGRGGGERECGERQYGERQPTELGHGTLPERSRRRAAAPRFRVDLRSRRALGEWTNATTSWRFATIPAEPRAFVE